MRERGGRREEKEGGGRTVPEGTSVAHNDLEGLNSIEIEELLPELRIHALEEVEGTAEEDGRRERG